MPLTVADSTDSHVLLVLTSKALEMSLGRGKRVRLGHGMLAVLAAAAIGGVVVWQNRRKWTNEARSTERRLILEDQMKDGNLNIQPIGYVESIFRLCVGTPRQGLLVPQARGRIKLVVPPDAVSGLEGYGHIWILFIFHLNTQGRRLPSKIAPPALGGKKVGVLATRSPHRYNPVGITLSKLDRVEINGNQAIVHISGVDLVDGTPVVDIKPFVGTYDMVSNSAVPEWVGGGLETRREVLVSDSATEDLRKLLTKGIDLKFYGPQYMESDHEVLSNVIECIKQVLAVDVRSRFQTRKARKGMFQAESADRLSSSVVKLAGAVCTQQIDQLIVSYEVQETTTLARPATSRGSGAEDIVVVTSIRHM